jgi:hypothetical protein
MRKEKPTWRPRPCRVGGRGSQPSAHPQTAPPPWDPLGCTFVNTLYNSNNNFFVAYITVCISRNNMKNTCMALIFYLNMNVFLSD